MNSKSFCSKFPHPAIPNLRCLGELTLVTIAVSSLMLSSCERKSQAEEDLANLKLIGYELDQVSLFHAVENDDLAVLKVFKEHKFDLHATDSKGRTGLHVAAEAGSIAAISYLIKNGALIDAADAKGVTPLMVAAQTGMLVGDGNTEVIRYLLKKGASAQAKDKANKFALIHALDGGSPQAIELLAAESRELLDTGLLYSANLNKHVTIPVLVRYGASVYSRNLGKTSLMIAAERGHVEAVQVLIDEGANLYAVSDEGELAKDLAEGDEDVIAVLLDAENKTGDDALALDWSEEELEALVQKAMERSPLTDDLDGVPIVHADGVASVPVPSDIDETKQTVADNSVNNNSTDSGITSGATVKRIRGKNIPLDLADNTTVSKQVTMAAYAEKSLPVQVTVIDEGRVEVHDLRAGEGSQERDPVVIEGSKIGATGLLVKQITKKVVNNKLTGGEDKELVTLVVEDERSGQSRELYAGYESQAAEAVAVLKMTETGEHLIVERNDEFYDLKGVAYKVVDVNDKEVIIENTTTGQLSLLPLMGVKR